MGKFDASLKTIGDDKGIPATVRIEEGTLSIAAGEADIGSWAIDEIGLEPTPNGYRLAAEGEQILIEMSQTELFADELSHATKKQTKLGVLKVPRVLGRKAANEQPAGQDLHVDPPTKTVDPEAPLRLPPRPAVTEPEKTKPESTEPKATGGTGSGSNAAVAFLDRLIDSSERRWGPLLPKWVFNRIVFVAATITVILAFVFRGFASIALVVTAVAVLMMGGAAYTDAMMASKLLPGRATPTHTLLLGVGLLIVGILFGLIA